MTTGSSRDPITDGERVRAGVFVPLELWRATGLKVRDYGTCRRGHTGRTTPWVTIMSLMHGLLPVTVQVLALAVLGVAISWRSRRWRVQRVPLALLVSVALAAVVH